jgi:hypothetical protein
VPQPAPVGRRNSPFSIMYEVLSAVAATMWGVVDSMKGLTYQTWTPAASRT